MDSSFLIPNISAKFRWDHAHLGHQKLVVSDLISRYISETVVQGNYGTLTGTCMRSIEWRYFQ